MTDEWVNLDDLGDFMLKYGLTHGEVDETLKFVEKYFLQIDESKKRAKPNRWACELFGASF